MIILFGMAGSGKGTQGKNLSEIFGWKWLSVGQVIRDTGKYAEIINHGGLIPDEDVTRLMAERIERAEADGFNVILDGYPRDEWQAQWLKDNGEAKKIDLAIILNVPKEELFQRLDLRGRDDDKDTESIEQRFAVFEKNMQPIRKILEEAGVKFVDADGTGDIEEVTQRLVEILKTEDVGAVEQRDDVNGGEIEKSYGE